MIVRSPLAFCLPSQISSFVSNTRASKNSLLKQAASAIWCLCALGVQCSGLSRILNLAAQQLAEQALSHGHGRRWTGPCCYYHWQRPQRHQGGQGGIFPSPRPPSSGLASWFWTARAGSTPRHPVRSLPRRAWGAAVPREAEKAQLQAAGGRLERHSPAAKGRHRKRDVCLLQASCKSPKSKRLAQSGRDPRCSWARKSPGESCLLYLPLK